LNEFSNPIQNWYRHVWGRPLLRVDRTTTPNWAWPGSRDPISKFWDPL